MNIQIQDVQRDLSLSQDSVKTVVKNLLEYLAVTTDEISIWFVDESEICTLHKTYFDDSSPTDCITFPIDPPHLASSDFHYLGEVFICPKVAIDQAKNFHSDPYTEISLYVIHGILHLLGYDDRDQADREQMEEKQKTCLDWICNHRLQVCGKQKALAGV